jgi:hypothetical protein
MTETKKTTNDKSLQDRAIDIKGKAYVQVADRVIYFNEKYPNGGISTEDYTVGERVQIKAIVTPDFTMPLRQFVGRSQAVWGDGYINKTSALENAETSAVGRALAFMGIGVLDGIASVDEINKAKEQEVAIVAPITEANKRNVIALAKSLGMTIEDVEKRVSMPLDDMVNSEAVKLIDTLKTALARKNSAE